MIARFIATICVLMGTTQAGLNGAQASLDISILEQAKDVYFDKILTLINGLQIPDINSSDGKDYLHDQNLYVSQAAQNVIFETIPENNEIKLTVKDLSGIYRCNAFRAHEWIFVAKGHIEVDLNDITITVGLKFGTQTLADGVIMPKIESTDVNVDIDRNDLKIHISGNIWTDFASMFTIFFKGTVIDLIDNTATQALTTGIPTAANNFFAKSDGHSPMPGFPTWWMDYQTPVSPIVTATSFELGIKGIMYDSLVGEDVWATDFADMPYKTDAHTAGLQAFVSDQSVNSLVGSFLEVHETSGWVNATTMFNGTALNLKCGMFKPVLPGLASTYGDDTPVNMKIQLKNVQDFTTSEALQMLQMVADVDLQIWVQTANGDELAVDLDFSKINANATFTITNFLVGIALNKFQVDTINVATTNIGKVNVFKLKLEINTGFKLLIPVVNEFLQKFEIELPNNILGLFTLSDLNLDYYDGYTYVGATPTFIAPADSYLFVQ